MRYRLSKLIPIRFTSTYHEETTAWGDQVVRRHHVRSTWWQWRDRVWRHRQTQLT